MARSLNLTIEESFVGGLARICKMFGGMTATSNGRTTKWVYDYANDCPCTADEMPLGSERWKVSELAKIGMDAIDKGRRKRLVRNANKL